MRTTQSAFSSPTAEAKFTVRSPSNGHLSSHLVFAIYQSFFRSIMRVWRSSFDSPSSSKASKGWVITDANEMRQSDRRIKLWRSKRFLSSSFSGAAQKIDFSANVIINGGESDEKPFMSSLLSFLRVSARWSESKSSMCNFDFSMEKEEEEEARIGLAPHQVKKRTDVIPSNSKETIRTSHFYPRQMKNKNRENESEIRIGWGLARTNSRWLSLRVTTKFACQSKVAVASIKWRDAQLVFICTYGGIKLRTLKLFNPYS